MITGWFQCCYLKEFGWLLKGSLDLESTTHSCRRFSSTIPVSPHSYLLLSIVIIFSSHMCTCSLSHWGKSTICCLGDINLSSDMIKERFSQLGGQPPRPSQCPSHSSAMAWPHWSPDHSKPHSAAEVLLPMEQDCTLNLIWHTRVEDDIRHSPLHSPRY